MAFQGIQGNRGRGAWLLTRLRRIPPNANLLPLPGYPQGLIFMSNPRNRSMIIVKNLSKGRHAHNSAHKMSSIAWHRRWSARLRFSSAQDAAIRGMQKHGITYFSPDTCDSIFTYT
jgi:hypothetical protein